MIVTKQPPKIYQLRITLKHTRPPIWRRIQVPGNLDLIDLHDIIQVFLGWDNSHLFGFVVGGVRYEDTEEISDPSIKGVYETPVSSAFTRKGVKGIYTYDFGDNWEHEVLVEAIIDPEPGIKYPICTDGKRSCPPEDCGGVGGYYRLLRILKDPTHEDYSDMVEWAGDDIDPDKFDCEYVNQRLPYRRVVLKSD
jgi:hypothetical protein